MPDVTLDIQGNDLSVYRDGSVILRGRFDARASLPRINNAVGGWRIQHSADADAEDVFDLRTSGHWFGGLELLNQLRPLEHAMLDATSFITSDNGPQGLSSVQSPLWLASSGVAILADHDQELHVGFNRSNVERPRYAWDLSSPAPIDRRPMRDGCIGDGLLRLGGRGLCYRLLVGNEVVEAWSACLLHIGHPSSVPPEILWRKPIWTTCALQDGH